MKVLIVTNQWPSAEAPEKVPFLVQQVRFLRQAGAEVSVFAFRGHKNPVNYLSAWFRLRRTHDLSYFDVIHAHFGPSGLLALPGKRPLVVTFHGTDVQGIIRDDGRYQRLNLVNMVSRVVASAADERIVVAERLKSFLPARLHLNVVPGGVDMELFRPSSRVEARRQLGFEQNSKLVLFAADPSRVVKRYSLAEKAVALLPPDCKAQLVTIANAPHNLVPAYMNACDVLLLTSKHEGSPTVIKEALACNLPIVSVDVGDVRQQLSDIPGCVISADNSPQTISHGLTKILRNPKQIPGRGRVLPLDEQLVAQRLMAIYERAIKGFAVNRRVGFAKSVNGLNGNQSSISGG